MDSMQRVVDGNTRVAAGRAVAGVARTTRPQAGFAGYVRPGADAAWRQRERAYAALHGDAELLARMIDQMGGGAGSFVRGSFVSLQA